MNSILRATRAVIVASLFCAGSAAAQELCGWTDSAGVQRQVFGRERVPSQFRDVARCSENYSNVPNVIDSGESGRSAKQVPPRGTGSRGLQGLEGVEAIEVPRGSVAGSASGVAASKLTPAPGQFLAAPEDVKLSGTLRREAIVSAVGPIELRWPRKVEVLFGRTPQRAMAEAAMTVSRALRGASFPSELQGLRLDWQVVFMDEELPETQIPYSLISNCHPAWMTPPANLYIVSQRIAAGCGGQRSTSQVADAELIGVLLHEMGHAVEASILKDRMTPDKFRAEGFATWFAEYASAGSAVIPKGKLAADNLSHAQQAVAQGVSPGNFKGTALDYALASQYFRAIVDRRGVRGLMDVYAVMTGDGSDFLTAVKTALGWDPARFQKEAARMIEAK